MEKHINTELILHFVLYMNSTETILPIITVHLHETNYYRLKKLGLGVRGRQWVIPHFINFNSSRAIAPPEDFKLNGPIKTHN